MKSVPVTFLNDDQVELSGLLEFPVDQQPAAFALFAHCFTCSKNLNAVNNISRGLTQEGIAVLRFDFTGLGSSKGDFADTNFSSNISDLIAAAHFLDSNYSPPQLLIGHSLGGTAAILAGSKLESIKAIATIGSPADPPHVKNLLKEDIETIKKQGEATVQIGGRPFKIRKQFLDDLEAYDIASVLAGLRKSLMLMHSPQDTIVDISNAAQLYGQAKHPKSFLSLDGANHLLTNKQDSIYVGSVIASWAQRYLELKTTRPLATQNQVAVRNSGGSYLTEIQAGNHHLLADEPEADGGTDLGPAPYDYLLASLGSCTAMTLRIYADHKGWPLEEVVVHLDHEKAHLEDSKNAEQAKSKLDFIRKTIEIKGDLNEEQRERLLEIADKCPVHRTLNSDIRINSELGS